MTPYKRGDVVLVPFPFSNLSTTKKRPAVVISATSYNESSLDIVILAITSKVEKSAGIGECLVQDWKSAGLLKPSAINVDHRADACLEEPGKPFHERY